VKSIAIAKRYADALYEEAKATNAIDATLAELGQFSDMVSQSKELVAIISSPVIMIKDKLNVINALGKAGGFSKLILAFFAILTEGQRMQQLSAIIEAFNFRKMNERNEIKVKVAYATPADDSIRVALKDYLKKSTGKSVILSESVEPKLLGGMQIFVGSTMYDTSIKGKLDTMRDKVVKKDKIMY
jgi:F-type H+-transporting ATPase subunit delta